MRGIELSEKYFYEYGEKMLNEKFSHLKQYLAVGIVGAGSECLGFDDDSSTDHDFEPGFCIFLPDENIVSEKEAFELEKAYSALPCEFLGVKREKLGAVGGNRHGVIRIGDFFENKTGSRNGEISDEAWFFISEQFLLEATNGKIFCDNLGLVTEIRERLIYLPEAVRLKKLAGNLLLMAQAGQYNYERCLKRGDTAAAQLSVIEFVNAAVKVVFLLNKKYLPYYKWSFRAFKELNLLSDLCNELEYLISSSNVEAEAKLKKEFIEKISERIIEEIKNQGLTSTNTCNLASHAYSVNDKIKDNKVRNLNIMYAV